MRLKGDVKEEKGVRREQESRKIENGRKRKGVRRKGKGVEGGGL